MFSPRQLFRQVVIISAVQLLIMAGVAIEEAGNSLVMFLSKAEREQQKVIIIIDCGHSWPYFLHVTHDGKEREIVVNFVS